MTVELDVFSGRPNPAWKLSPAESAKLAEMLKDIPPSQMVGAEGGLGYRGFVLSNPERAAGLPTRIRIYNGMVIVDEESSPRSYRDTHGVERALLRQASERGYGEILKALLPAENQPF